MKRAARGGELRAIIALAVGSRLNVAFRPAYNASGWTMKLTRYGLREILICAALLGLGGVAACAAALTISPWYWLAAGPLLASWLFSLAFFRDPTRIIPTEPGVLVAPADGRVTEIAPLPRYQGIDGPALRVGIFLSIFDVHINRSPCAGRVVRTDYRPGEFLDARHGQSGARNEANTIVIEPEGGVEGPVIVRQIAGLIARRIVCQAPPGADLKRGQKIGMIKFGSRTELIVPAAEGMQMQVRLGDHVTAGDTVLMRTALSAEKAHTAEPQPGAASSRKPAAAASEMRSSRR